ncbi:MAG TPA: amidohydrolase family protein, partial [Dehalococcoidia bacterium]|nr:amidohydrolase family protein [Dehalococcoidia bacterium]
MVPFDLTRLEDRRLEAALLKIDLHAHSFPLEYLERLRHYYPDEIELREAPDGSQIGAWVKRRLPGVPVWDGQLRLSEIERDEVTMEVLSSPLMYTFVDEHSPELCRLMNDTLAAECRRAPECLRAFAHLPFNDMSAALAELSRAVDELGCIGVLVTSNLAGRYLHTPEFEPFWAEVNRRRLPVFMHPSDPPQSYDDETSTLL